VCGRRLGEAGMGRVDPIDPMETIDPIDPMDPIDRVDGSGPLLGVPSLRFTRGRGASRGWGARQAADRSLRPELDCIAPATPANSAAVPSGAPPMPPLATRLGRLASVASTLLLAAVFPACAQNAPQSPELVEKWKDVNLYQIQSRDLAGEPVDLAQYAGKVTIVVNVASRCGLTPQYAALQALYEKHREQGLVILGFPSRDFGGQEFENPAEIREFCDRRYSVTFPMMTLVQVKPGPGQCRVFEFLGTRTGALPGWNFGKYLVGRDGVPIEFFSSTVRPDSEAFVKAVEKALAAAKG